MKRLQLTDEEVALIETTRKNRQAFNEAFNEGVTAALVVVGRHIDGQLTANELAKEVADLMR
jgi:hypothetical protein